MSLSLAGWDDMQVVVMPHDVDWGLLVSALPLCLLSRAANIFPLAALANRLRTIPIPFNMQVMQWLCGLRGAIAYALVINLPQQKGGTQARPPPLCTLHPASSITHTPCSYTLQLRSCCDTSQCSGRFRSAALFRQCTSRFVKLTWAGAVGAVVQVLETATLMVVVVTTLVGGAATGPMLALLGLTQPPPPAAGSLEEYERLHPPSTTIDSAPHTCR